MIDPRLQGAEPVSWPIYGEGRGPKIVCQRGNCHTMPAFLTGMPVQKPSRNAIVSVPEDGGRDPDNIAENSFYRVAP